MATVVNNQDTPPVNLQCQYCSSSYSDPRILACLHSFCLECLAKLYEEDDITNDSFITCPTCNHRTALPAEGDVASMPVNIYLSYKVEQDNIAMKVLAESPPPSCEGCEDECSSSSAYCNDCNDMLCDDCWMMHKKQKTTKSHSIFRLDDLRKKPRAEVVKMVGPSVDSIPYCQYHPNQKLIFYCHANSCRIPVCVECVIIRHDQTKGHVVNEVDETHVQHLTTDLKQNVNELKDNKETLEGVLQQIEETKHEVQAHKDKVDGNICRTFDDLRRVIDQREKELLKENAKIASSKNKRLSQQQKGIERMLQSINDCISITSSATDEYSNVQLLAIANTLDNRANGLQQQYTNTHLDLVDTPDINVDVDSVVLKEFIGDRYGSVTDASANGRKSTAMLPRRRLQATMEVEVTTRNTRGKLLNASCRGTKVKATLLFDGKVINDDLPIINGNNGKYHVNVSSNQEGRHQLIITVNGQDIKGSPFDLTIVRKRDYTQLAKPVRTITGINDPRYIAFSDNGDMFVTSSGDHRIHVYDVEGNKKTTIGFGRGNGRKQFKSPYGIDIHGDVIYVADRGNHRIQHLTTDGEFICTFGTKGISPGQFNGPHDVKISPTDGKVYVADTNNDRIQVFNPDWTLSHVIDGTITGDGCFSAPKGIAFDLFGNVVISAYGSSSVLVFTAQGIFICQFCNDFNHPTGIAIDASGYYLINSYDNTRFAIYNSSGKCVRVINGISAGYGVAVSPNDQSVWVADPWNNKLFKH